MTLKIPHSLAALPPSFAPLHFPEMRKSYDEKKQKTNSTAEQRWEREMDRATEELIEDQFFARKEAEFRDDPDALKDIKVCLFV